MKLFIGLLVAISIGAAAASCPGGCSGHGFCEAYDLCKCYPNWSGLDCSGRKCPQTKSWADTALLSNDAHNYATCGSKGACDGKSGQCDCAEPFEGKGCRRMACLNGCSGHGTCDYIEELALNEKCAWDATAQARKTNCVHSSIISSPTYSAAALTYTLWDRNKIQGCQCDPGWAGDDCSGRICPMGNDPLRTRTTDSSGSANVAQSSRQFKIHVGGTDATWVTTETAGKGPPTIVLGFTDTYNEKWYTRPISIGGGGGSNVYDGTDPASNAAVLTQVSLNVFNALMDLPNAAITGAAIDPVTGLAATDPNTDPNSNDPAVSNALTVTTTASAQGDLVNTHGLEILVDFKSPHNTGSLLNKLACHTVGCTTGSTTTTAHPGGCAPMYTGMTSVSMGAAVIGAPCTVTPVQYTGTRNLDTCSNRGNCNGDGLCECLEGYTDEDCSLQTVLA